MSKIKGQEIKQEDMNRFERKIFEVIEGVYVGCHETTYARDRDGYSSTSINGNPVLAHRLMYQIWHPDEDIDGKLICHRCDNPACVNPEHLFSGTNKDNMTDKVNKDRQTKTKGSINGMSKLIECDIVEIINGVLSGDFTSCKDISDVYDISLSTVRRIINQKTWKHITKDFDMIKVKSLLDNNHNKGNIGSKNPRAIFNDAQVKDILVRLENEETCTNIANFYNIQYETIRRISTGKTYQYIF